MQVMVKKSEAFVRHRTRKVILNPTPFRTNINVTKLLGRHGKLARRQEVPC